MVEKSESRPDETDLSIGYALFQFIENSMEIGVGVQFYGKLLYCHFSVTEGSLSSEKSNGFLKINKIAKVMCGISFWYDAHY